MSNFELIKYADAEALAQAVAARWLAEIEAADGRSTPYRLALSGGRIARQLFAAAAALAKAHGPTPGSVHFFWGDERCVPPTDPESNFALARDLLLAPLGIPAGRIHRIRGETPPAEAAVEAEAELRRVAAVANGGQPRAARGQPVLDLIFLGMGEDGHVASLFPGEPEAVRTSPAVYRPVVASKPPPHRITLGYAAIAAARQVWVLASGLGKESALRESVAPGGQTPLAQVLQQRQQTRILTDIRLE